MSLFPVRWRYYIVVLAWLAMAVPASASASPVDLLALRRADAAVLTVGHRLAAGAATLCGDRVPAIGLMLHDLRQYGPAYRDQAARVFGLREEIAVLAVAASGPADRAGVRADDWVVSLDGEPPVTGVDGFTRVTAAAAQLERAGADGWVDLGLVRNGQAIALRIPAEQSCRTRFQTRDATALDAAADGRIVEVTTAMVAYARDLDELAIVLGHELAHNILNHAERLRAANVSSGGLIRHFGRSARIIRETEVQADLLGVHLADRAGFAPGAALLFWERLRRDHGGRGLGVRTHPGGESRVASIRAEIAWLASEKAAGRDPRPSFAAGLPR